MTEFNREQSMDGGKRRPMLPERERGEGRWVDLPKSASMGKVHGTCKERDIQAVRGCSRMIRSTPRKRNHGGTRNHRWRARKEHSVRFERSLGVASAFNLGASEHKRAGEGGPVDASVALWALGVCFLEVDRSKVDAWVGTWSGAQHDMGGRPPSEGKKAGAAHAIRILG